jgi:hypothetical protein
MLEDYGGGLQSGSVVFWETELFYILIVGEMCSNS